MITRGRILLLAMLVLSCSSPSLESDREVNVAEFVKTHRKDVSQRSANDSTIHIPRQDGRYHFVVCNRPGHVEVRMTPDVISVSCE